jgi:NAD-dependent SIR2 family protein deacetylase
VRKASDPAGAVQGLRRALAERSITFVLGAGVSKPRGVPDWRELTRTLWAGLLGEPQVPRWLHDGNAALARIRAWAEQNESPELAKRLCFDTPHPLADQMAIELLHRKSADERVFVQRLRAALYSGVKPRDPGDTLGVLARILAAEQAAERRRVLRVITFNADDHLETEGNQGYHPRRDPVLWPIARESGHPRMARGAKGKPPIPVYHVHGFLPRDGAARRWRDAPDTLVFTDAEYWATVASPLTFANRVMAQALHDSTCIFIGVSMYDVNLIRWLGVRYNAICDDVAAQRANGGLNGHRETRDRIREALLRHFWIRRDDADPHGLIGELLDARGVRSVRLEAWGEPFEKLMLASFGLAARGDRPRASATARTPRSSPTR